MCGIWGNIYYSKQQTEDNEKYAQKISHRGPDKATTFKYTRNNTLNFKLVFHRLAIVDIDGGEQPFIYDSVEKKKSVFVLANGEIYNYKEIIKQNNFHTKSDCHVILDLYLKYGNIEDTVNALDGEFAFVLIDNYYCENTLQYKTDVYMVRDRFGIRPLFASVCYLTKEIYFSSEMKGIPDSNVFHIYPRTIYKYCLSEDISKSIQLIKYPYYQIPKRQVLYYEENENLYKVIRDTFIESVEKRMYVERGNHQLGCLLSGGLDSSLIAGIASKILREKGEKLYTFSIGMSEKSPDLIYARQVAEHIKSVHQEVIIPPQQWVDALPKIIYQIETFDTTTIRASTGQYLLAKWISENTAIKVILNGDGSDELCSGYMYFHNAPSAEESHYENERLLENIHYYDVLRVDRGISAHGLEARVPFLSHKFVDLYLSISPQLRIPNKELQRMEKYLLRKSFESMNIIPESVLWRKKEAFSDGVSLHEKSWFQIIEESLPENFEYESPYEYQNVIPKTKEAAYFKKIFDYHYPKRSNILETQEYWLPKWSGNVVNPSARVLDVYNSS